MRFSMATSLKEILATHGLTETDLGQICSREHRDELAGTITNWKEVGIALEFTQEDLNVIDGGIQSEEQKKTALLFQWSMRDKKEATYLRLAEFLFDRRLLSLLNELCRIINKPTPIASATSLLTSTSELMIYQPTEVREQEALMKDQSESHASEAETSLQLLLKSEANETTSVTLSERDIVHLMQRLQQHSSKWNPIGLSLGFTMPELNNISCMITLLTGAPVSYLQELLSQWVQWPTTDHPSHPTVRALCIALRSSLVGLGSLAQIMENEFNERERASGIILVNQYIRNENVAVKIEQLENKFRDLHKCIRNELQAKDDVNVNELLQSLTLLPTKLKNEYEAQIMKKLPTLQKEESISQLFLHLNPLFTFIDYTLLEYIIQQFGSAIMKQRMQGYSCEIQNFMNQTTVQQLIDYWPCNDDSMPNVSKMIAKIKKNPQECKLSELDALRKKMCISMRLSDIICAIVSVCSSQSFIVAWRLPSILAQVVIESLSRIDKKLFELESIESVSVDDEQVYPILSNLLESAKVKAVEQEPNMGSDEKRVSLKTEDQMETFASLQLDEEIQKFIICGVPKEKELGKGSFGLVKEIEFEGLVCAGKLFNEKLFAKETVAEVTFKYVNLCRILSNLRHPNIIQFIGLCFIQNCSLPMIITEKLEGDLHYLLESVVNIPMTLKHSLLEDITRGLHYLHTFNPTITHGALTARNVLYTSSLVAKLTDIGSVQLVKIQSGQQSLEAHSDAEYIYSPKHDMFSLGHLAIFILTQVFPTKIGQYSSSNLYERPSQSEIEYIDQCTECVERLLPNHPLVTIVKNCLHSDPKERPTARQMLTTLEEIKTSAEGTIALIAKMNTARQVLAAKHIADMEYQLKEITEQHNRIVLDKEKEIGELMQEIKELKELEESKDEEIKELRAVASSIQSEHSELMQSEGATERAVQLQPAGISAQGGTSSIEIQGDIELTLLCGYFATPRDEPTPEGYTHDWTAFVRNEACEDGSDIEHVVRKVVFQLHESFEHSTRVVKKPPYKISGSGNGSFDILIKIYFNNNEKAKFQYGLQLYTCQISSVLKDTLTFQNPSKTFREKLILAGGRPCHRLKLPISASQKEKPKKRRSESTSAAPPKSKKKRRLEIEIEGDSDLDTTSWSETLTKSLSSDSSSDEESQTKPILVNSKIMYLL